MKILIIDCCIRTSESRTRKLLDCCMKQLRIQSGISCEVLSLVNLDLKCLYGQFFEERQSLLARHCLDHPRFRYAHQFAEADRIVIAAPLWDLSFPALLKVYLENVSVDGITFYCDAQGMHGICRASRLLFLTTRGGFYEGTKDEQGCRYLKAFGKMCGIQGFHHIAAEGIDFYPDRAPEWMDNALAKIPEAVEWLLAPEQ